MPSTMGSITIIQEEGEDNLPRIVDALQKRFLATKARNPLGYKDQFEAQYETHLMEVAQEVGAAFDYGDDGDPVFDFHKGALQRLGRTFPPGSAGGGDPSCSAKVAART